MFNLTQVILLIVITAIVVGYASYRIAQHRMLMAMLSTLTEDELTNLEDIVLSNTVQKTIDDSLTQEVIDGNIFLYTSTGSFVAQGRTTSEAAQNFFKSDYSSNEVFVRCENGEKYKIVNGSVEA